MTATDSRRLFAHEFALRSPDFVPAPNSYYADYLARHPPQQTTLIPDDFQHLFVLKLEVAFTPRLLFKLDGLYELLCAKSICSFSEYRSYLETLALPVREHYCLASYADDYVRRCQKLNITSCV